MSFALLGVGGLLLGLVPQEQRVAEVVSPGARQVSAFAAAQRAPFSVMPDVLCRRGAPEHLLVSASGVVVLVFHAAGGASLVWFDGRGAFLGETRTAPLDPARSPVFVGPESLLLPLADGTRVQLALDSAHITLVGGGTSASLRRDADELARRGELAAAVAEYERVVASDPTDAEAWRSLARALERTGDGRGAQRVLTRANDAVQGGRQKPVSMDWRVLDPRARLALDLVAQYELRGDSERARRALDDLARLYPCMEEATLCRAKLAEASDPVEGPLLADAVLRETIARLECPRARAAAHLDAAAFHERARSLDLARAHLTDVLALGEQREVVLRALARIDTERGDYARAVQSLTQLRERWAADLASVTDERRRAHSQERLDRLDRELAALATLVADAGAEPRRR